MSSALVSNQHELLLDTAAAGLVFGTQSTRFLTLGHPQIDPNDPGGSNDLPRLREDGVQFGEEYVGSKTVSFEVGVLTDRGTDTPHADNGDALDFFESSWTSPGWRNKDGAYGVLRSHMVPGRVRRCYGRPRRFAAVEDGLAKKGYSTFLADFTNGDGLWYDDNPTSVATPSGVNGGTTTVAPAGTRATWPVVTIYGGCVSPRVVLGNLLLDFPGLTIPVGHSITIDSRPWSRGITRTWSADPTFPSFASTTLKRMSMQFSGLYLTTFTAASLSGAGACAQVSWRSAWSRW